ncbi:MAG: 3-phosphoglycerate dehydrogenase [Candidatus Hadarchaeum yellowstonense]|jgi:D-3-phosphoglycerate dehydrogenase|uniref:3-phosphoglycerate dehydrogenase n=1 Tax=Hadarchaeum yellowstonense TaxID=1776334 RepID=A0A147JXU2_HADYE|nr:MAG: 3-phosphoglycerate dehydrogenase [Candidatus Hadarchaeum yellowstonense]
MVKVLVTDKIDEEGIRRLREVAEVDVAVGLKPPELIERVKDYEVLVVRSATKVTREVIEAGKKLRIIGRAGAGVDNIDVEAAKARGIKVLNTPEAPTEAVAELVMGLMLSWARRLPQADLSMKQGKWLKAELMGTELRGKTLGIIGTGKIGQRVGFLALAFGMKIVAQDCVRYPEFAARTGCEYTDLDTVLRQADYLTIHLPLTAETRHLIGKRELSLMKPTAVLINTSRGEIVDETALVEALTSGKIAGACLDVFSREPPVDSPLLKLPNVILTPHIGASTHEAQKEAAILISEKIKEAIA